MAPSSSVLVHWYWKVLGSVTDIVSVLELVARDRSVESTPVVIWFPASRHWNDFSIGTRSVLTNDLAVQVSVKVLYGAMSRIRSVTVVTSISRLGSAQE